MEFMALTSPRFDIARFGAEAPRFSPRQSRPALGRRHHQPAPGARPQAHLRADDGAEVGLRVRHLRVVRRLLRQLHDRRRASTKSSRCDVYVPGCPPRPEAVLDGLLLLQDKIARGDRTPGDRQAAHRPGRAQELVRSTLGSRSDGARCQLASGGAQVSQLVLELLQAQFGAPSSRRTPSSATTPRSSTPDALARGRALPPRRPALDFDMFVDLCGVDYLRSAPSRASRSCCHLYSLQQRHRVRLKARVGDEDGTAPRSTRSCRVWTGAELARARDLRHDAASSSAATRTCAASSCTRSSWGTRSARTTRPTARSRSSRSATRRQAAGLRRSTRA